MQIHNTKIPGCKELVPFIFEDKRGRFVKTFVASVFAEHGLEDEFVEEFYTVSVKGVIRGLHFQVPPASLVKVVYCLYGSVVDAVVDLRGGSPTYGEYAVLNLNAKKGNMLYIPPGLAHGFCVVSRRAVLVYKVSFPYAPEHDTGIRWDTVGIPWPEKNPFVSERDRALPAFSEFRSPFRFNET